MIITGFGKSQFSSYFSFLKNKELNSLLAIGVCLEIISLFSVFFGDFEEILPTETYKSVEWYWFYFWYGIIVAPILEEIIFDGAFLKSRILQIISYLGLFYLVFFLHSGPEDIALLFVFYGLSLLHLFRRNSKTLLVLRIICNSLLFSTFHLDIFELNQMWPISLASRFGGHLIALWLVLNYKLVFAILYHLIFNLILSLLALSDVNFEANPNKIFTVIETKNFIIEYAETDFISQPYKNLKGNNWSCRSCTFEEFYKYHVDAWNYDIKQTRVGLIYDIHVLVKNDSLLYNKKGLFEKLTELLQEEGLIEHNSGNALKVQ